MSKRVAVIATLVTLALTICLVLVGCVNLSGTMRAEALEALRGECAMAASAVDGLDDCADMLDRLADNASLTLAYYEYYGAVRHKSGDIEYTLMPEDASALYKRQTTAFIRDNADGASIMYAITPLDDGAFLIAARENNISWNSVLYGSNLPIWIVTVFGLTALVFVLTMSAAGRKERLVSQMMLALERVCDGKYESRLNGFKGRDGEQAAEYNTIIARLQEIVFKQRSRNHALSVVMNQMQNGIIAVDANLKVILVTPVAKKLLGIVGNTEGKLISEASKDVNLDNLLSEAMQQAGVYTNEVAARTAMGRGHRPLRLYVSPMRQEGEVVGALAMIEDITELRRLEQVRTDFVANVSHELKTPLTSIRGFVETLMDGAIHNPPMAEKFLKIIMLESERLTRLINDILSISKLESGNDEVALERIRLDKVAYDVADMLAIHAGEKEVTVNASMNAKPIYIIGNPDRVEQMLINLIENGIKYNKPGGSVTVQVFANETEANVTISDTGIGISEEHLPRMFERFYRVDKGRSRSMGGTGLGLAIVKHIIRTMNGEIEVHSKLGEGTEFLVTLPLAPKQDENGYEDILNEE